LRWIKNPAGIAPVWLKKPEGITVLAMLTVLGLLVSSVIQRQVRLYLACMTSKSSATKA
jgi:transposase